MKMEQTECFETLAYKIQTVLPRRRHTTIEYLFNEIYTRPYTESDLQENSLHTWKKNAKLSVKHNMYFILRCRQHVSN